MLFWRLGAHCYVSARPTGQCTAPGKESHWARECTHTQDGVRRAGGESNRPQAAGDESAKASRSGRFLLCKETALGRFVSFLRFPELDEATVMLFKLYSSKDPRR